MSVGYTKTYKFDPSFELEERKNKSLYINFEDVNWFRTNDTGKEIILKCDGTKNLGQVINEIAVEKNFSADTLKILFDEYIGNLIESGVIYNVHTRDSYAERATHCQNRMVDFISDLWIHVTSECNLSCPFCYSLSGKNNVKKLEFKKITDFLAKIEEEKRNSIIISGGEPFLYDELVDFVRKIKELNYKSILVITNGTVGEEKYADVIPYVDGIQVSVDGTCEEVHDISRGKGSYSKMLKNLTLLKKLNVKKLIVSFTPTINNILDLPNLPKFAYDNGVDAIHITRLMPVGRGKEIKEALTIDSEDYDKSFVKFIKNFNKIQEIIVIKNEKKNEQRNLISLTFAGDQTYKVAYRQRKITCGAGLGSMSIYYDGNIYPCASLQNTKFSFGTIDDSVERVILEAQKFMKDVSVDTLPECKDCKFKYMCGGGCRACAYAFSGNEDIYAKDPMCERYKKEMLEIMWQLKRPVAYNADVSENPIGS